MKKLFKSLAVLLFVGVGFFTISERVEAACPYRFTRFDTDGKTEITLPSTVKFVGTIASPTSYSNIEQQKECANKPANNYVRVRIEGRTESWALFSPESVSLDKVFSFSRELGTLSGNPSSITFLAEYFDGFVRNDNSMSPIATARWTVKIAGTGSTGTGQVNLTLGFEPSGATSYNKDQNIYITVKADSYGLSKLPDSAQEFRIVTKVNGVEVGGSDFIVGRSSLASYIQKQSSKISAPPYNDGRNDISVSLYEKNTAQPIGQVLGYLTAQGLGVKSHPTNDDTQTNDKGQTDYGAGGDRTDTGQPIATTTDTLYNPLPEDNLTDMLLKILKGFLLITGLWAVTFIVIGGFRMVMAAGNEEAYQTAKKTITWAILGFAVAMLSFGIIAMVQNFLGVQVEETSIPGTSQDK